MAAGACGGNSGGDSAARTQPTSAFDRPTTPPPVRAEICSSQTALNIGHSYAAALNPETAARAGDLLADMQRAARAAPEALRADFVVVVEAQRPFIEQLLAVRASGNYASIASDNDFQSAVQRLADPAVVAATGRINAWFAANCARP